MATFGLDLGGGCVDPYPTPVQKHATRTPTRPLPPNVVKLPCAVPPYPVQYPQYPVQYP